jgi:DNA-binding LytR/AlgR family response regulator
MKNILIVEDEEASANYLESLLKRIDPDFNILEKLSSVKETVKWLATNKADIIFLDIELSDGLCFSIFDEVKINTPIIITTAYNQFAIKAFQINSIAYLLKPVSKEDLEFSLSKLETIKSLYTIDIKDLASSIKGDKSGFRNRFLIQYADKLVKIETKEIAYFFISDNSVYVKTFKGECFPMDLSLNNLEKLVDPARFFRINRKYLISCDAIIDMRSWSRNRIKIKLSGQQEENEDAIVSIYNAAAFKKWLNT